MEPLFLSATEVHSPPGGMNRLLWWRGTNHVAVGVDTNVFDTKQEFAVVNKFEGSHTAHIASGVGVSCVVTLRHCDCLSLYL